MALGTASGFAAGVFPLAIALLASVAGLANALLVPLIAPIALVLWLPRERRLPSARPPDRTPRARARQG